MSGTFACDNCGETFDKGCSDEEAEAEAQELFPGIDTGNSFEAGIVCDDCFNRIMGRVQAEAPELIGEGWRNGPQPIPDFPGFVERLVAENGYGRNPCSAHCPDRGSKHAHLRTPDGQDFITWADGRYSGYDLTQPARLIYPVYPAAKEAAFVPGIGMVSGLAAQMLRETARMFGRPADGSRCYQADAGFTVHVKPGCRCPR